MSPTSFITAVSTRLLAGRAVPLHSISVPVSKMLMKGIAPTRSFNGTVTSEKPFSCKFFPFCCSLINMKEDLAKERVS